MAFVLSLSLTLLLAADAPAPAAGPSVEKAPAAAPAAPAAVPAAQPAVPAAQPVAPAVPPIEGGPAGGQPPAQPPAGNQPEQQPQSGFQSMIWMIVIMLVVMWFLVMRPQKKYQRERQAMLEALKKRDLAITRGGIIGTVVELKPERDEVLLEIAKNVRVRIRRAAIEGVLPPEESESGKE